MLPSRSPHSRTDCARREAIDWGPIEASQSRPWTDLNNQINVPGRYGSRSHVQYRYSLHAGVRHTNTGTGKQTKYGSYRYCIYRYTSTACATGQYLLGMVMK